MMPDFIVYMGLLCVVLMWIVIVFTPGAALSKTMRVVRWVALIATPIVFVLPVIFVWLVMVSMSMGG